MPTLSLPSFLISPALFVEHILFLYPVTMASLSKINWPCICAPIFELSILFLDLYVYMPVTFCLDYCSFLVSLEVRKYESSKFVIFFRIV